MTTPATVTFATIEPDTAAARTGELAMLVGTDRKLDAHAHALDARTGKALTRFVESETFEKLSAGTVHSLSYPAGLEATALHVVKLDRAAKGLEARAAGAALGKARGEATLTILAAQHVAPGEIAYGAALRDYAFIDHKTGKDRSIAADITVLVDDAPQAEAAFADRRALAEGVFFTRDLVNAPSNVLTTTAFADRLADLRRLGLSVEVLEEDALEQLGMRTLLAVGQGSDSPTKVVVMQWNGGDAEEPLVLAGKGVVFDTGGISLKSAAGMEDMTADMGGAGTISGVMKALALRKAEANVVGIVGLVENMPDGKAVRPGDVIVSMKGDTIEIINTDAEGRLVLADVLWYAQERFNPRAIVDLATLTNAVIVGLGHENAGLFANDDELCDAFLRASRHEGECAWRLPLGKAYDDRLKSRIADMKNVAGRPAGAITGAQFLQRFIKDGTPWLHLDIAGVAAVKEETTYAPKGATGWGVQALDRFIADRFES